MCSKFATLFESSCRYKIFQKDLELRAGAVGCVDVWIGATASGRSKIEAHCVYVLR
jgi:hypothetical protein